MNELAAFLRSPDGALDERAGFPGCLGAAPGEVDGRTRTRRAPDFRSNISTDYIIGMANVKGTVKALLNIDAVISSEALKNIKISPCLWTAAQAK